MASPLTIEEIASLAHVSRSTVSRVLNDHPNVRAEVRERVLATIREHNYAPRAAARNLASNRTQSICFLFSTTTPTLFHDPFMSLVMQGIMTTATERGYFVVVSMVNQDQEQAFYSKVLRSRTFDGLILLTGPIDDPLLPHLLRDQFPFVLCEKHAYLQHVSWVEIDNRGASYGAVRHLLHLGHRRIATITGPLSLSSGCERRDGYKQALLESGIGIAPELIVEGNYAQDGGYKGMQQLMRLPNPPTAVYVASDLMAIGAIRAIRSAGLRVPEDIAVVGFDDLPITELTDVPLTTVHQPIVDIGATAARILLDQLEHQDFTPVHEHLPTHLVVRESCGATLQAAPQGKEVVPT